MMFQFANVILADILMLKKVSYIPFLESCWQEHSRSKEKKAPTVISLFAGGGGSSLGYSMAGFKELLAVEWNDNAVETFKSNFPDIPIYHGDITGLSTEHVLEMTKIKKGELDILDGSPPCQGFSTAGKRDFTDTRNQLFKEYVRLLKDLKPKVFVMENVSGLVKGVMRLIFVEILKELKAIGYKVSARLLNTMYFNVPQSRQRIIFIGVREDLGMEPSHPKGGSIPITVKEALPHIDKIIHDSSGLFSQGDITNKPSPCLTIGIDSINSYHWKIEKETSIEGYAIGKEWEKLSPGEESDKFFNLKRIPINKPSQTITKEGGQNSGIASITHPIEKRKLSIAELKRIGSFPDNFIMNGTYAQKWAVIGNSVPPLFMRSIALHIKNNILNGNKEWQTS